MAGDLGKVLASARASLGYREHGYNGNKFSSYWGRPAEAWCADAACYWLAMGHALDVHHSASTPVLHQYYLNAGRAQHAPRIGSLAFFDWPNGPGGICHVGLIESLRSDGRLVTLEGNTSSGAAGSQSDGDGAWRRVRSRSLVAGYGHPIYASTRPPVTGPRLGGRTLQLAHPPMTGQDVLALQRILNRLGNHIAEDGAFGPETDRIVRVFQAHRHLTADGVVGPATTAALRKVRP